MLDHFRSLLRDVARGLASLGTPKRGQMTAELAASMKPPANLLRHPGQENAIEAAIRSRKNDAGAI